jgi:hypothetical protein
MKGYQFFSASDKIIIGLVITKFVYIYTWSYSLNYNLFCVTCVDIILCFNRKYRN